MYIKNAYKHPTMSSETAFIYWFPKVRYALYFHLELDTALRIYQSVSPVTPLNVNSSVEKEKEAKRNYSLISSMPALLHNKESLLACK